MSVTTTYVPAATRDQPPGGLVGPVAWARANLFGSWLSGIVSIVLIALILRFAWTMFSWGVLHAVWTVPQGANGPDTSACRNAIGVGACWALVPEKYRFILFGFYPYAEQWRPAIVIALFLGLFVVSANRRFWRIELLYIWLVALVAIGVLMWGGVLGMTFVPQDQWGGLPITLILSTFGLAFAFPLAILVALGRRSTSLPAVKMICVLYVELIRGVPLISLLFMSSVMFPLFMPEGIDVDKLLRAQIAIILFAGAYLAEVVRAGLQALPKRPGGGGGRAGFVLRQEDLADHPAAGAEAGDSAVGEHLHRLLQGYVAGADHRHLRLAEIRPDRHRRSELAELRHRAVSSAGGHLFRLLLRNVQI